MPNTHRPPRPRDGHKSPMQRARISKGETIDRIVLLAAVYRQRRRVVLENGTASAPRTSPPGPFCTVAYPLLAVRQDRAGGSSSAKEVGSCRCCGNQMCVLELAYTVTRHPSAFKFASEHFPFPVEWGYLKSTTPHCPETPPSLFPHSFPESVHLMAPGTANVECFLPVEEVMLVVPFPPQSRLSEAG